MSGNRTADGDKITTLPKSKVGEMRRLDDAGIVRLNRAVLVFLGLSGLHLQ